MTNLTNHRNGLSRMIDDVFTDFPFATRTNGRVCVGYQPAVNIVESDEDVRLIFEVPGMKKEDIKVMIKDGALTVSGQRSFVIDSEKQRLVHREIAESSFSRSFTLSDKINADNVKADYSQGLLTITLAKQEEAKPKEIEISVH